MLAGPITGWPTSHRVEMAQHARVAAKRAEVSSEARAGMRPDRHARRRRLEAGDAVERRRDAAGAAGVGAQRPAAMPSATEMAAPEEEPPGMRRARGPRLAACRSAG